MSFETHGIHHASVDVPRACVFLNRTLTSHDAHVTHTHIFSCVAQVPTRVKGHLDCFSPRFLKSHSISFVFHGTLLDAPFTSPWSIPFPTLAPSPMTTPSLLFPSTSSIPASPQGGMLHGRLAEQSPFSRTTLCILEDNETVTKHVNKCRSHTVHHEARTHRVDSEGFSFVRSSGSDQRRQHNTTTFILSNLSVSSEQMCRRLFRCICNCKADKATSLHRNDCEVVKRQECRRGRSRSTSTSLQKLDATPSFAVVDGAPKALDFRAVEPSWRVALEAASASRANPRTCRGADCGLPRFPLKEELVEAAEEGEIFGPHRDERNSGPSIMHQCLSFWTRQSC